jgi:hypothetical protein
VFWRCWVTNRENRTGRLVFAAAASARDAWIMAATSTVFQSTRSRPARVA